jgi:hypothetical protein
MLGLTPLSLTPTETSNDNNELKISQGTIRARTTESQVPGPRPSATGAGRWILAEMRSARFNLEWAVSDEKGSS